jgi:hypothetical protein
VLKTSAQRRPCAPHKSCSCLVAWLFSGVHLEGHEPWWHILIECDGSGKNRPLDEGELEFFEQLDRQEQQRLRAIHDSEAQALAKLEALHKQAVLENTATSTATVVGLCMRPKAVAKKRVSARSVIAVRSTALHKSEGAGRAGGALGMEHMQQAGSVGTSHRADDGRHSGCAHVEGVGGREEVPSAGQAKAALGLPAAVNEGCRQGVKPKNGQTFLNGYGSSSSSEERSDGDKP